MNYSSRNSINLVSRTSNSGLGSSPGDMNRTLGSGTNSGPSLSASSMVTDANSALSGAPHLQRSSSFNTDSYMRLPASPMSFSSNNNFSISGSSVLDGSSLAQHSSQQDQIQQRQQQQGASSATTQSSSRMGHVSAAESQYHASSSQDPNGLFLMQSKPRIDFGQEDLLQQQYIQQMLQKQDSFQLQRHNPQVQALIQLQRLFPQRNQQQILQSVPQLQRAHLQQQFQTRQPLPPPSLQLASGMKRPYDSGICARRLMQYMYHQRQRPPDNSILYWRKFVAEYFAPRAKKRWCFSLYENVGHNALGIFTQAAADIWHCDICGSKSGRGFEASFEVLPRLNKIKFDSGAIDELLFIDMPMECRFPSGMMMLEYRKAIQESVYEQTRVVREGRLRIIFSSDLKILSWEFCAQRHEEFLLRRLVAPQVNHLVQVAQKYQNDISECGSAGVSSQDLQTNCNMFISAGRQLARNLDLQLLNDLGFSKRYVRFLQISEVVNTMKDLIDFSREHKVGPIESLKKYPRQISVMKDHQTTNMEAMEHIVNAQGLVTDENAMNKASVPPSANTHADGSHNTPIPSRVLNNSAQPAVVLRSYQNFLRLNSMHANSSTQKSGIPFNGLSHSQHLPLQVSMAPVQALQNAPATGMSSPHHAQQEPQQTQQSEGSQNLQQQHVIQQWLQEIMNENGGMQQPPNVQNTGGLAAENAFGAASGTRGLPARPGSGLVGTIHRSNSFNAAADSAAAYGGNAFSLRQQPSENHRSAELDIPYQFTENGSYNTEQNHMSYAWKS